MNFVSTRVITADVARLVAFYEMVTGVSAVWGNELFAEIPTPMGTLAIGSVKTPKELEIWDDLPRSKVGKVLKREIRAGKLGSPA